MRYFILFAILITSANLFAQEKRFTFSDSVSVPDLITLIEKSSDYRFYYRNEWIDTMTVHANFVDEDINTILGEVFSATPLNYFILDRKVILSYDALISDEIHPELFFGNP